MCTGSGVVSRGTRRTVELRVALGPQHRHVHAPEALQHTLIIG